MSCNIFGMETVTSPFKHARLERGLSLEAIGSSLGVHKTTVMRWEQKRVPAELILEIERVTGIPRHELRPDLFPPVDQPHEAPQ